MKRAVIVGSEGQAGRILFDQLAGTGAAVLGIGSNRTRSTTPDSPVGIDITNRSEVLETVRAWQPDEIYYLAAYHHSSEDKTGDDAELFERSFEVHVCGLIHFLEAMKQHAPDARLFYAASSLVFGTPSHSPQNEDTPLAPQCVYGITKVAGIHSCRFYRESHDLHVSVGILYNHESPLRRAGFVSQKIVRAAIAIARGSREKLVLGDLSARVDWGYAPDFTEAMQRIVRLTEPDDYIIATGEAHSVQEFVEIAFRK